MTESASGPSATPAGPEMGAFSKLVNVFFSPAQVFESVARKPGWDWLLPVALMCCGMFFVQTVLTSKIDADEAVKAQMKIVERFSGGEIPEAQREEIEKRTREDIEKQKRPVRKLIAIPFLFGVVLLVPAIYKGIAAAMGVPAKYKALLAGYAWVQIPNILAGFLTGLVAMPKDRIAVYDAQFLRILKSNIGAMLPWETTHKALLGLLSSVDLFDIWALVLGAIMVSKTTGFSKKGAYGVVGGVWGVYIVLKVIGGVLMQSFGG
jgi:uncharacterized membrane protein